MCLFRGRQLTIKILFIVYDNEGSRGILPLGTLYIASYLKSKGYKDIQFYNQDVYHYPDYHITEFLSKNKFDIVGIGFVAGYYQHGKIVKICEAINMVKNRPFIVLGGHGPSPIPEFYLRLTGADAVVIGEGELPFYNLVNAIENSKPLNGIKGIAYRNGEEIIVNPKENRIIDLETIPCPSLELVPIEYYVRPESKHYRMKNTDRVINMITGRGCAYNCNFCQRLEKGTRLRSVDAVIDELKKYIREYNITYVIFWDELFMASKKRVYEISEAILRENIKMNYWCTGRLNIADRDVLKIMKRSGCTQINYGIEQFDNEALKAMNKNLTEEQIIEGIENTQEEGILIDFNIIFGNIGDTRESLKKSLSLLKKYNDYNQLRTIRPVTPYPGSTLYNIAIDRGLLKGPEDFYEKHKNLELLTVNFTDIPDDEFHRLLCEVNEKIIGDYYEYCKNKTLEYFKNVYSGKTIDFRGARH